MRVLHYSHDTSGTEHIQRTLAIAEQVSIDFPQATQLLVTDTPQPRGVKLPHQLDFIKLPGTDKSSEGGFHDPSLLLLSDVREVLRENLILSAIKHFHPDVIFVNKVNGEEGELAPSLSYLQQKCPETKLTVGMDDIKDDALLVRNALLAAKESAMNTTSISARKPAKSCRHKVVTSQNPYAQASLAVT